MNHRHMLAHLIVLLAVALIPALAQASPPALETARPATAASAPEVEAGFRLLYDLKFSQAREQFEAWQRKYPDDPQGEISIAASYLFEELYRQGVLSADFFLNDKRFLQGIEGEPDEKRTVSFKDANRRARELAQQRLEGNAHDPGALYALTLAAGMEADYSGILEKRQLDSLRSLKQAERYAKELLAVEPSAQDAWLAVGAADYIVGSLPVHKRLFLQLGGIHGDKKRGLDELQQTAANGHYLRPLAKILLALACLREKQDGTARLLLSELRAEFPNNPLIAYELARLQGAGGNSGGGALTPGN
ncbi:MAG TPA: hypothetical protein VK473_16760 [Terriglobales bacterium]|nr:hypothetical protein [Terriglobales bacterium]